MSSILTNLSVIQKLAKDLVQARHLSYSQQCIPYYIDESKFCIQHIEDLRNPSGHLLKSTLIRHRVTNNQQEQENIRKNANNNKNLLVGNTKCVVFLHGLGSSRLEALPLVASLPSEYCLFAFDFAGSGKSQGVDITYGLRESEDISSILDYLRINKGIRQFVIWGRSMGAVAGLLYSINLAQSSKNCISAKSQLQRVKGLVIDSPFSDFRQVTKHIGLKRVNLPQFLIDFALSIIQNTFNQLLIDQKRGNKLYNPFQIKLGDQSIQTKIPTIFVYSEIDEVVPKEHSQRIIKVYRSTFDKFVLQDCTHNQSRPKQVIDRIFETLKKFQTRSNHPRALSNHYDANKGLTRNGSFDDQDRNSRVGRRGISVQSKEKQRSMMTIQNNKTQQSQEHQKCSKIGINSYSSLKIQPRRDKLSCKKMTRNAYMETPTQPNNPQFSQSPLKIRISSNSSAPPQPKISISVQKRTENSQIAQLSQQSKTVFYNTIEYDNSILQKKLLKGNNGNGEDSALHRTLENRNSLKYRRGHQINRKVQYQLNHTRYL